MFQDKSNMQDINKKYNTRIRKKVSESETDSKRQENMHLLKPVSKNYANYNFLPFITLIHCSCYDPARLPLIFAIKTKTILPT